MKKTIIAALSALLFPALALCQSVPGIQYVAVAPTRACSPAPPVKVLKSTGTFYPCVNGQYAAPTSSGSVIITYPPYNAKCDGQPTTDDGPAINAALASGASTVYCPLSTGNNQQQCDFTTTINVPGGVTIERWAIGGPEQHGKQSQARIFYQ